MADLHSKPLAIVPAYNEGDMIGWVVRHLMKQGMAVYVYDTGSRDQTFVRASDAGAYAIQEILESPVSWSKILEEVERIAQVNGAGRWCMINDADEIRYSPNWPQETLAEWFARIQEGGYNAAQFKVRNYWPVDNGWDGSKDPEKYFRHYARSAGVDERLKHGKAWLQGPQKVNLHSSGGHSAFFDGMWPHPEPGLIKHYPIRSQQHGERKVFLERNRRWAPEEKARKWHVQYDGFKLGDSFLKKPEELVLDYEALLPEQDLS